jgi:squalene-hopene cyclase-like protein
MTMTKKISVIVFVIAMVSLATFLLVYEAGSSGIPKERLVQARQSAVEYLEGRLLDGNYTMSCVSSDNQPCPVDGSGHVFSLYFLVNAFEGEVSEEASSVILNRIRKESRGGLWGYNDKVPLDADDSAFVLRTLKKLGKRWSPEPLFKFYKKTPSAFVTFESSHFQPRFVTQKSTRNNKWMHPEVNANIYQLLAGTENENVINLDMIANAQHADGYWKSYFYPSRYYNTYVSLGAVHGKNQYEEQEQKALAFLKNSQNENGSWGNGTDEFETALALNALAECDQLNEEFVRGLEHLLEVQLQNGSWKNESVVWEYQARENPDVIWKAYDKNSIAVTSLAVSAINAYLKR